MRNVWTCKIGEDVGDLPSGADSPMRDAIARAYRELTGRDSDFIFSGWGGRLTESERAVVEDRLPDPSVIVGECHMAIDDAIDGLERAQPVADAAASTRNGRES